ncbi:hypothetical protein MPEAHAMD_0702 [Methylobacterium frigidaeris]|uniref:Uncharacterized protein n=1 Tax=Methylobacterium frigidaeris TaxID=2038277 RepID=A0AA37M2F1_9HYPH|nr:hypothetical protein MPEAHAMD_0702 [Methylobacterium frigidaeris]
MTPVRKRLVARLVRGLVAGFVAFAVLWLAFHLR